MKPAILILATALACAACTDRTPELPPEPDQENIIPPTTGAGTPAEDNAAAAPTSAAATPGGLPSFFATPAAGEELPTSQTTPGPIPLKYRHVWSIEAKDCRTEPALTRIAIAPNAVRFYEGRSVVTGVTIPHENALTLEVDHMAEGEIARETHALVLENGGQKLAYQRRGQNFTYTRCPI